MFDPSEEPTIAELTGQARRDADGDLATRHAPVLLFDVEEPFLPLVAGYTVFRQPGRSVSSRKRVILGAEGRPKAATAIEYAIWWDWDINHLYDLEHIWVYLDAQGQVTHAEGSRHGRYRPMTEKGEIPLRDGQLTVFSEAGKHGFAPVRRWLETVAPVTRKLCTRHAGLEGVLIPWLYRGIIRAKTPEADRLVHTHLERFAFWPTLDFAQVHPLPAEMLVPWPALFDWIPRRVAWWVSSLRRSIPARQRRFLRIAGRSASAQAPENTRAAIARAAEAGADMVKLDVQQSADGVPVIYHGEDLSRTTNGSGPVSRHALRQLQSLDAGNGETIPTLDEAIACCREHHLGLYLEIESDAVVQAVVQAIRQHRLHDRVGVCAVRPEWLARVKALDRKIVTTVLSGAPQIDAVALARAVGADYVHAAWGGEWAASEAHLQGDWVRDIHSAGLGAICSHGGCVRDALALRQHGFDGVCSPAPELLRPRPG